VNLLTITYSKGQISKKIGEEARGMLSNVVKGKMGVFFAFLE
jgi:hypothetical protein